MLRYELEKQEILNGNKGFETNTIHHMGAKKMNEMVGKNMTLVVMSFIFDFSYLSILPLLH